MSESTAAGVPIADRPFQHDKSIAAWLLICCATLFFMVVLGGVTRLTGSGLSMVDWQPIMGVLPPLTDNQWLEAFSRYQAHPEFKLRGRKVARNQVLLAELIQQAPRHLPCLQSLFERGHWDKLGRMLHSSHNRRPGTHH